MAYLAVKLLLIFLVNTNQKKRKKKKQVTFRLGADGNEWCWVMGELDIFSKNIDEQIHISEQPNHR